MLQLAIKIEGRLLTYNSIFARHIKNAMDLSTYWRYQLLPLPGGSTRNDWNDILFLVHWSTVERSWSRSLHNIHLYCRYLINEIYFNPYNAINFFLLFAFLPSFSSWFLETKIEADSVYNLIWVCFVFTGRVVNRQCRWSDFSIGAVFQFYCLVMK